MHKLQCGHLQSDLRRHPVRELPGRPVLSFFWLVILRLLRCEHILKRRRRNFVPRLRCGENLRFSWCEWVRGHSLQCGSVQDELSLLVVYRRDVLSGCPCHLVHTLRSWDLPDSHWRVHLLELQRRPLQIRCGRWELLGMRCGLLLRWCCRKLHRVRFWYVPKLHRNFVLLELCRGKLLRRCGR